MNDRFMFRLPFYNNKGEFSHFEFILIGESLPAYNVGVMHNNNEYEQCIGLKDKNGNLIYENDRVGFYVYGQDEEWHAQQGTVIWYNSCWGIETSSRFIQFENELTIKNPKDIEIIGNIHKQAEQKE